jgi:hypothetical protein
MTTPFPFGIEVLGFIVHTVRFAVFPLVFFAVGRAAGLVLVSIFLFSRLLGLDGVPVLFVFGHCGGGEGAVGWGSGSGKAWEGFRKETVLRLKVFTQSIDESETHRKVLKSARNKA